MKSPVVQVIDFPARATRRFAIRYWQREHGRRFISARFFIENGRAMVDLRTLTPSGTFPVAPRSHVFEFRMSSWRHQIKVERAMAQAAANRVTVRDREENEDFDIHDRACLCGCR